jgi:hypothetical protein
MRKLEKTTGLEINRNRCFYGQGFDTKDDFYSFIGYKLAAYLRACYL